VIKQRQIAAIAGLVLLLALVVAPPALAAESAEAVFYVH
jgi:hypothetical protein